MNWHAEKAEERLEALYPDIDLILVNSPDPGAQASALEDLVSVHQIDALVVLPFESEPLTDPVLNVKKSGALITVVDRGLSQPGIEDIYVAGNNPELGRVSAVYMKGRLKEGDNIVVLRGIPTLIDNERFDAFMAEIEGSGINVLDHKHANWNRDDGFEVMQDFLSRFPDIDAVWAQDDDIAIGVVAALKQAGRDGDGMFVVGGAGMKETIKSIMDGDELVPVDVLYPPAMIATAMDVTVAAFKSNGPVAGRYILGATLITPENAELLFPGLAVLIMPTSSVTTRGEVHHLPRLSGSRRKPMKTIKGPALFLAQFAGDEAPFNSWESITKWAADCGYKGVQVPSWDGRLIDLEKAASSKDYCDEFKGVARENGVEVTELSTHLQGQLVAVHPAYDEAFDGFAAPEVRGNPKARQEWAVEQVKMALTASRNMGIGAMASFSGALAWPYIYPWPQRPAGLVETAFDELAAALAADPRPRRGDAASMSATRSIRARTCMTASPSRCSSSASAIMPAATCSTIRRITCCSASTISTTSTSTPTASGCSTSRTRSSIRPDGRASIPATRAGSNRAGRFRSLGDGQVDFGAIFSKLAANDFDGWAVVEWECCLKHPEDGAREGAAFVSVTTSSA
jgi:ribose transport system substrate-binding protein